MQTRKVVKTIRWIQSLIPKQVRDFLFLESIKEVSRKDFVFNIQEVGRISEIISQNAYAVEVLKNFGLGFLLDRDDLTKRVSWLISPEAERVRLARGEGGEKPEDVKEDPIFIAWQCMIGCVTPLENLTIPKELHGDKVPENILTMEIRSPIQRATSVPQFAKAVFLIEEVYESVVRVYRTKGNGSLTIIKVGSGSVIRIDCKGLGEPIKHLKDLIIEAWYKLRHKKAEKIIENNKAILSSLAIMDEIVARERDKILEREEAEQLRRKIITSVYGLFECGTLIAEIPEQEMVQNAQLLLSSFIPKQLPPPKKPTVSSKPAKKKTGTRKKTKMKRK